MDPRFFRKYLDIISEAGEYSNMPGAKAYSDAADPMADTNAQYQQKLQNISAEKGKRLQDHLAARDAYRAANGGQIDSLTAPAGPSGDPLSRSFVTTTDLVQKERAAGDDYGKVKREKTGGGHWQYDKKTVDSAVGPISQTNATYIATPTKGEVIRQGLAGGGSLYNRKQGLAKSTPDPRGALAKGIQSATTDQPGI